MRQLRLGSLSNTATNLVIKEASATRHHDYHALRVVGELLRGQIRKNVALT